MRSNELLKTSTMPNHWFEQYSTHSKLYHRLGKHTFLGADIYKRSLC